jgi:exosortase A
MAILRSSTDLLEGVQASPIARWRSTLIAIGVAILIFAVGFDREASDAVRVWIASTAYNHCFLILPIVGYLLWERRAVISTCSPRPAFWPLLLVPPLSAAWLLSAALDITEGRQLLTIAMFEIALLSGLGPQVFRRLLAPLLFLFFLVPSGDFLIPSLQSITAKMAVVGLGLLHIPVFSDGNLIDIPEGSFEIAEACAGLRFLVASSVFSCLFAVLMYRSWWRRGLYIALSIVAAIAANGIRAFGIILLVHLLGSAAAVETDHILYGWLFFSLVILLLIGIGLLMREREGRPDPLLPPPHEEPAPWFNGLAVPLSALIALAGPGYAAWRDGLAPSYGFALDAGPRVAAPWHSRPAPATDWRPMVLQADRQFHETFEGPSSAVVTLDMALYRLRPTGNGLTSTANRVADGQEWHIARQGRTTVSLAGRMTTVNQAEIISGPRRRLVWWFYLVDGSMTPGLLEAKLLQLRAVLFHRRPVGAYVAIAASTDDPDKPAARELARFLAAIQPLPAYLEALPRQLKGNK